MSVPTVEEVEAGQVVYNKYVLAIYDLLVLGFSCQFLWKCPADRMAKQYDKFVSNNHLDVGVGTGYFLDRCYFPSDYPRIALMDLNNNALMYTSKRISRYRPEIYCRNVLEPIFISSEKFDSVGVNFLLHCLPGDLFIKGVLFDHLMNLMAPNAVIFGSTILQSGVSPNRLAKRLMRFYNEKGVFSNQNDSADALKKELEARFTAVSVEIIGCVALFSARNY